MLLNVTSFKKFPDLGVYKVEARKLEHHYPQALKAKYKGS